MQEYSFLQDNKTSLERKLASKGREGTIVAVTKKQSVMITQACIDHGYQHIAESKIQDAAEKKPQLTGSFTYHMIGHLQSNKVKEAVRIFDIIQSVDSIKLLHRIQTEAEQQQKQIGILLQGNITGEPQKYGFSAPDLQDAILIAKTLPMLHLQGCMCMGKCNDHNTTKQAFQTLKHICEEHDLPVCSIGMSQDRPLAIECGSSMLRLGTVLFER